MDAEGRERARQEFVTPDGSASTHPRDREWADALTSAGGIQIESFDPIEVINIAALKTEQERWISVEERLPELGHIVLACSTDKIIDTAWLMDEGLWYLERTAPQDELITYRVQDGYVTHWQELPAPPVHKGDS